MSASLAHAEYYPYHGNLGRIPWTCTTNEDERYPDERIRNLEQRRIYRDYERKTIDWKATYTWIEEGIRDFQRSSFPCRGYALDTTVPHRPRIKKTKDVVHAQRPIVSQEKTKGGNDRRRWRHFVFGKGNGKGK